MQIARRVAVPVAALCIASAAAQESPQPVAPSQPAPTRTERVSVVRNPDAPRLGMPAEIVFSEMSQEKLLELAIVHDQFRRALDASCRTRGVLLPHGACYGFDPFGVDVALDGLGGAIAEARANPYRALYNVREAQQRKGKALDKHDEALLAGLRRLREGDYGRAIVALTLAAKLDHGDPSCRLHLAQARLAQGHYTDAGKLLRRALELQPKLVYVDMHLDDYYPKAGTLRALDAELSAHLHRVAEKGADPVMLADAWFLQGFTKFQLGEFDAAYAAFRRVAESRPRDDLTRDFLDLCKPPERVATADGN